MSYEMFRTETGEVFRWTLSGWNRVLLLASLMGWRGSGTRERLGRCDEEEEDEEPDPCGCRPTHAGECNGDYSTNGGQLVTGEDAANLAAALEETVAFIPDVRLPGSADAADDFGEPVGLYTLHLLQYFSGDAKQYLQRFIAFCRKGPFEIW